ncbi:MAG: hypothetical protein RQ830_06080 [Tepidimonas sp.]|nr:hypothetical protein [Tepidimonas sp.]
MRIDLPTDKRLVHTMTIPIRYRQRVLQFLAAARVPGRRDRAQ